MKTTSVKFYWGLLALSVTAILCWAACSDKSGPQNPNDADTKVESCPDPQPKLVGISLLPLGDISTKRMNQLKEDLQKGLASVAADIEGQTKIPLLFEIEILPKDNIPDSCYYKPRNRYRADKILMFLKKKYGQAGNYVIGVTDKDISTSIHGAKDYGIQGLSYLPGNVSIISTYRVKNKKLLWKLAAHEFCHGYFELRHCGKNDQKCLIKDAEGGNPHFELKETLCDSCIRAIHWH